MSDNDTAKELLPPPLILKADDETVRIDSPETIVRDLLKTEKYIAIETLRVMRLKHERERIEWEKLFGGKEKEIHDLTSKLDESENRIRDMSERLENERHMLVEQLKDKAKEYELQRVSGKKKWELIEDEIKSFRDEARGAQLKLAAELAGSAVIKKETANKEKIFNERINEKEEEVLKYKEQLLLKEKEFLQYRSDKENEIGSLKENLEKLKASFEIDMKEKGVTSAKKEADIESLKNALHNTIIQLNSERKNKEEALSQEKEQLSRANDLENELKNVVSKYEIDRSEYAASFAREQADWEKYKNDYKLREEALKQDTEEQVSRILKSVGIIEQQLKEEQAANKSANDKIRSQDEEIKKLIAQKDEIAIEWRKILSSEQELRLKRQGEILAEFDKIKASREEDLNVLRGQINSLNAALAEANKLYSLERERNSQLTQKTAYLEESRQNLVNQLDVKEKTWKQVIMSEQELFKRQIEESVNSAEAQVKSRDGEIARLDEDINMLNGQVLELRQKLSLEKNENNNRLERISEYETQIQAMTAAYNQAREDWDEKIKLMRHHWEEQFANQAAYQAQLEESHRRALKTYEDRISSMKGRIHAELSDPGDATGHDPK